MNDISLKIVGVCLLGIGAQWVSWRIGVPAIVLLAISGIVAGPVTGLINPVADFGEFLNPGIKIAVAVILFEGGLGLRSVSLGDAAPAVRRLVFLGVPIGWLAGTGAAHYVAGLSWPVAAVLGGIMVVTGPTVIIPLLRQAKLDQRCANILKWEAIINDPIGAMLAVLAFEVVSVLDTQDAWRMATLHLVYAALAALLLGWSMGRLISWAFRRGLVPEFLKSPILLVAVLVCFEAANRIGEESGLITVTVFGYVIGNARLASLVDLRKFKESITILLVSSLFVVLTATLSIQDFKDMSWRHAAFVAAILFFVRPLTIWTSTILSGISWREKALIGWIAPRGVVAIAVGGLFGPKLVALGYPDAGVLEPLVFLVVFATVLAHGLTIQPLARLLGQTSKEPPGVLIVGATPWSIAFAQALVSLEVPVLIVDRTWHNLRHARQAGIPVYFGEILSELTEHRLDMHRYAFLLAATENDAYNALVCTDLGSEFGRSKVFQIGTHDLAEPDPRALSYTLGGRKLALQARGGAEIEDMVVAGWKFRKTRLTENFSMSSFLDTLANDTMPLLIRRKNGRLDFLNGKIPANGQADDVIVSFAPPSDEATSS
ncbi:MAG: cation:proton antiporter [Rhodospirillales bacterium]|nr:cation:proton antiporter [Rhodospirillales bacterium]